MANIIGKILPLKDKIFVSDMHFGEEKTKSGLIILSDDGKGSGIKPRWGKVWAIGPEQKDVKVGEWILIEHGRWSRTVNVEDKDGNVTEVRIVDNDAILLASDHRPDDIQRNIAIGAGSNVNLTVKG